MKTIVVCLSLIFGASAFVQTVNAQQPEAVRACIRAAMDAQNACIHNLGALREGECIAQTNIRTDACYASAGLTQYGTPIGGGGGQTSTTFNLTEWNNWFSNWWLNNANYGGDNPYNYIEWYNQ